MIGSDTAPFFDVATGFAVVVIAAAGTFNGILDRPYGEALSIGGENITLTVPMSELPIGGIAPLSELRIGNEVFFAKEGVHEELDRNVGVIPLGLIGKELVATGVSTYMDAGLPTSNFAGSNSIRLRTGVVQSGLIRFDLSPIPAGATIRTAQVSSRVRSASGPAGHDIETFACVRPVVISQATWNEFATSQAWAGPGATNTPLDFLLPPIGDALGTGVVAGSTLILAQGTAASDWVQSSIGAGYCVLLVTIELGTVVLDGDTGTTPPTLTVIYEA